MEHLKSDPLYGGRESAKLVLQNKQGKELDAHIKNVLVPALVEASNAEDQAFLKKHLHVMSLIARNVPERSIFANNVDRVLVATLNVNGNDETKVEQVRVLYRLVQNYSDRLTFVTNAYQDIISFVIRQMKEYTENSHVSVLMCMDFLRIMCSAVPEEIKKHYKEILDSCFTLFENRSDKWTQPETSELLTLISQLLQLSMPRPSYHHPTHHNTHFKVSQELFEKLLQTDTQNLIAAIYVAGVSENVKWTQDVITRLSSEMVKKSTDETKEGRTSQIVLLKSLRKAYQYYDHEMGQSISQDVVNQSIQAITKCYNTSQDSGKRVFKQKVECAVTKIICIMLNRLPIASIHPDANFLELNLLKNSFTHSNMYPIFGEYFYVLQKMDDPSITSDALQKIVPKLLQKIQKVKDSNEMCSKSDVIRTLNALVEICQTTGALYKPYHANTLESAEFLLHSCLVAVGVDAIRLISKLFCIEFQSKKFPHILNKMMDILNHRYESDKVRLKSDSKEEVIDIESDLILSVLSLFQDLLNANMAKDMLDSAGQVVMNMYHLLSNGVRRQVQFETDFAEISEMSNLGRKLLLECGKLDDDMLQGSWIKEWMVNHFEALKSSLKDGDTQLAITLLKSINHMHDDENQILMRKLIKYLNEPLQGANQKKNKKNSNQIMMNVFTRHLKECVDALNKYKVPEGQGDSDDEEDDEFAKEMDEEHTRNLQIEFEEVKNVFLTRLEKFK
ncbi:hypothetical protein AKO1_013787 [Acrasis kona]|uniref:Uncharacterized protein n=1 Tax=Acrasis kona TaxID=1008807 RepID=A0AAW2ZII5_9EUKA